MRILKALLCSSLLLSSAGLPIAARESDADAEETIVRSDDRGYFLDSIQEGEFQPSTSGSEDPLDDPAAEHEFQTSYRVKSTAKNSANTITLAAIGSDYEGKYTIPAEYLKSWQIPSKSYQVISGSDCIDISSSGLVTPHLETWYSMNGGFWTTMPIEGAAHYTKVRTGTAVIRVTQNGQSTDYTINVQDYVFDIYAVSQLDQLKKQYIPSQPTEYQILEGAAKIAASFNYDASYYDWKSMVLNGGGDCWASTGLILQVCEDYGIQAKDRNANRDPGSGSGHRNVIAKIGNNLYIADAGYVGDAPRYYKVEPTDGFSYSYGNHSSGRSIYQYDGFDTDVKIPAGADSNVTELDTIVFKEGITSVSVPSSIEYISPMYTDDQMIYFGTFSNAQTLQNIHVDSSNANYCDIDGVLFTKDRKTLLQFPAGRKGSYTIPEGTETIGPGAFCQSQLDTVTVPASVKTISDWAFIQSSIDLMKFKGERPAFGSECFWYCHIYLESEKTWPGMDSFNFGVGEADVTYCSPATAQPISGASVSGISSEYIYTGQAISPKPVLKAGEKTLVEGKNYTLSYSNNVNAGTATITITGIRNYKGTIQKTFTIKKPASGSSSSSSQNPNTPSQNPNTPSQNPNTPSQNPNTPSQNPNTPSQNPNTPSQNPSVMSVSMHRLYNPNSGEHFYTKNSEEKDHLVSLGWKYEGQGWKAPESSKIPVYRLYNPNAGDHHYTMDKNERDTLVKIGWNDEGIGWYSDESKSVPLYRQYNPNAKAGSHNYTTDKGENDGLVKLGWQAEGIAWYGMK